MRTFVMFVALICAGCSPADRQDNQSTNASLTNDIEESAAFESSETVSAIPRLGRCYMGTCSWSIEKSRQVVRKNELGALIRLTLLGGESEHPDGDYDRITPIKWNKSTHETFVFCSKYLPSVFMKQGSEFQIDGLDFIDGVPGILESSANLYTITCHGPDESWSADSFARRHDYESLTNIDQLSMEKPSDIFQLASRFKESRQQRRAGAAGALEVMPEELLNSDQAAIYGYTCRVNDMRRRLVLFTTDPSASNQSVDGTAKLNGRQLRLQGDRDITRSNSMRLRDGEITVIVEVDGELVAKGDAGDQADGRGTLTIFSDQSKTMPVLISCIEM